MHVKLYKFVFLFNCVCVKTQVGQLDSELSRTSLRLIEKESELHAKTAYCHQLELKLAKTHQDVKKIGEDYGARLKAHQLESSRQEAAILDYAEKLRKVQVMYFILLVNHVSNSLTIFC